MNFVTRKALARRTFLKGAGATVALPFLDAMAPALSAAPLAPPRLGFLYVANGVILDQWIPKTTGRGFELPAILQPLEPVRDYINVISGLSHREADTKGDGNGDHPRASAAWLTGVHAYDRTVPGVELKLATSADQIAAQHIGKKTPISSIEMTVDMPAAGACDSGDCFFVNTVSWRSETTPNATEMQPRVIFERLFGDGGSAADRKAQIRDRGSILDSVSAEAARLAKSLGGGDRGKLGEYMDSVREIEQRIQSAESQDTGALELPDRPAGIPENFEDYVNMMLDLQLLAFQSDSTRVFSMILARELSTRTFGQIGVPDQHHAVSHHRDDPELIAKKARIDTHHASLLSGWAQRLKATPDGDGSLLDHMMILYGGGMGNGNLHRHSNLPTMLIGKQGGKLKTGYHMAYKEDTPMANLLVTILDRAGVPVEKLGDSSGPLDLGEIVVG